MRLKSESLKLTLLITFSFALIGLPQISAGQDTNRPRVARTPTPSPTPKSVKPRPTPTPIPRRITDPRLPKITFYVQSKVNSILNNPMLRRGRIGVRIDWLDRNTFVYTRNPNKYFMPASNMKSYTVAAAIDSLGPNFRFVTSVYANSRPDSSGTLRGNLIVYGRGDPSFSTNFNDSDYYKAIDALADKIAAAGVKRIDGAIVGDETYFNAKPVPYGWEWDDLQWYYGAEISSLSINDNAVDLKILPGSNGTSCLANISPMNRQFRIVNKCRTTPKGTRRKIRVKKTLDANIVEISGTMPENDRGYKGAITFTRPAKLFVELLKQRLALKGIQVTGKTRALNRDDRNGLKLETENLTELVRHQSVPLSLIAQKTMKPSQNLYTELILRALGEERGDKTDLEKTSAQKGKEIVQALLRKAGAQPESVVQYDGSGLSRHNIITPNSAVKLFSYMYRSRNSAAWRNSLTIGGVDGTLRRRFKTTSAESNVRGKTGTIDQVSALSGYVTAKSGERFVFSILTNNIPNSRLRVRTIDDIVVALADYDSRDTSSQQ